MLGDSPGFPAVFRANRARSLLDLVERVKESQRIPKNLSRVRKIRRDSTKDSLQDFTAAFISFK